MSKKYSFQEEQHYKPRRNHVFTEEYKFKDEIQSQHTDKSVQNIKSV